MPAVTSTIWGHYPTIVPDALDFLESSLIKASQLRYSHDINNKNCDILDNSVLFTHHPTALSGYIVQQWGFSDFQADQIGDMYLKYPYTGNWNIGGHYHVSAFISGSYIVESIAGLRCPDMMDYINSIAQQIRVFSDFSCGKTNSFIPWDSPTFFLLPITTTLACAWGKDVTGNELISAVDGHLFNSRVVPITIFSANANESSLAPGQYVIKDYLIYQLSGTSTGVQTSQKSGVLNLTSKLYYKKVIMQSKIIALPNPLSSLAVPYFPNLNK